MKTVGLIAMVIAGSLLCICAANSAPVSLGSGQVWSFQTPFGIIYGTIPREVVDYPATHSAGTIVVSTAQRRRYYVLGGGKAIRYGIAVGMEGYAWARAPSGLSGPPPYDGADTASASVHLAWASSPAIRAWRQQY